MDPVLRDSFQKHFSIWVYLVIFHSLSFPIYSFSLLSSIVICARFVFRQKQATKEDFRDLAHSCKNAIHEVKEHQELTLASNDKGIKKTLNQ